MKTDIKVLLAEDNPIDVAMITHVLESDYSSVNITTVDKKADYTHAISHSDFDIILCDHFLKDFNSFEALDIVSAMRLDTPLIIVTGNGSQDLAFRGIQKGAYDYVLKSDMQHLTTAVRNALNYYSLKAEVRKLKESTSPAS